MGLQHTLLAAVLVLPCVALAFAFSPNAVVVAGPSGPFIAVARPLRSHRQRQVLSSEPRGALTLVGDSANGLGFERYDRRNMLTSSACRALGLSATLLALLPAGPANAEEDEEDEEDEEERKKILPRPVSLGLKAIVVAGTLYALAELYTAPKIETETRRGEEATGERGKEAIRKFVSKGAEDENSD